MRARRLPLRRSVDQNRRVVVIHHRVSEIVAANSEIARRVTPSGSCRLRQFRCDFTTERIVTEKNVSDAGDENAFHSVDAFTHGSTSSAP